MACMKLKCIIQCILAAEFLLLLTFLTPLHFMAQGRVFTKPSHPIVRINEEKVVMMRTVIGSKPPRCENERCKSCGHCEAVQVPIVPAKEFIVKKNSYFHAPPRISIIAYSRGNYISNYKPISWKCKCGDLLFNP